MQSERKPEVHEHVMAREWKGSLKRRLRHGDHSRKDRAKNK